MVLLGIDLGSSSVKASLVDADTGGVLGSGQFPRTEMAIDAPQPGWAEQDPEQWWGAVQGAVAAAIEASGVRGPDVKAIGIAYQMHGLVCLDRDGALLRPSIIWCDSRAVPIGDAAYEALGRDWCQRHLLNSPGNFTASKLRWVIEHQPDLAKRIHRFCLPGDAIAARLTGQVSTTVSGLSEGMLWDFHEDSVAQALLDHYEIAREWVPDRVPTFGVQGELTGEAAVVLGLSPGTPVTYRAGDQPNNAMSLNVWEPGQVAATAGTSGVVYGVTDRPQGDDQSRVNTFAHVNHTSDRPRLGTLLCINGTGIVNAWTRRLIDKKLTYSQFNALAETAPVGCDGLCALPFGNGAERMLNQAQLGASLHGVDLNRHGKAEVARAVQEGVACAFQYGLAVLQEVELVPSLIRAGHANLFLSPIFRQTLATLSGVPIELYDTDGSVGAARGAGIGLGVYQGPGEAFESLTRLDVVDPDPAHQQSLHEVYERWTWALEASLRIQGNHHGSADR